jgi:hypothetical protein
MFQVIKNFLWRQKSAPYQETQENYLPYFANDAWPLEWHDIISKSPSGTACVSTIADFLEGIGFTNPDLDAKTINTQGETWFQGHHKICKSYSEYEGFYIHFMFDGSGKITEWKELPFENCRLGKPDSNGIISKIYYNPFFGTKEYLGKAKKDTIIFNSFDLNAVKAQIGQQGIEFKGQVLFVGTTTPTSRFYPLHEAVSAKKWMKSEAGIADYHEDNIDNGLLQPYILIMKGNPNQPSTNPEYSSSEKPITVGEEFQEVISREFMGAKRVGNLMVQWVNNNEEAPTVVPLPSNATGDLFITLDNQATKKITVAFKVPAILANINEGVSLGGDGNMVRVAVKLMQQRVIKKQRVLTDVYNMIGKNMANPITEPFNIAPYNPYPELEVVDDKIWEALTPEERRKWINENTEIELIEEEAVATPDQPVQSMIRNAIPTGFPESIRNTVKKALDIDDKLGKGCGKRAGRAVAEQIVNNENMGQRQLKRILSYLKKRPELKNSALDSCDAILYNQWGGSEMEAFLEEKLKFVDEWLN